MTILLPAGLPAAAPLMEEGFDVRQGAAEDACPGALRIALVNLMPDKPATELQIARMLAAGGRMIGRDVRLTLTVPDGYRPKTTPAAHMRAVYTPFAAVRAGRCDGVVVTGAPVETLPFADVAYWPGLRAVLDWAAGKVGSTWCICWAAQAALHHFHGTPKHLLPAKAFGVHRQTVRDADDPLMAGLGAGFAVPVSRHAEVRESDLPDGVRVLAAGTEGEGGLCLLRDRANRMVLQFNHPEYDGDTLLREFRRDVAAGRHPAPPANCPLETDADARWRPAAVRMYANWLAEVAAAREAASDGSVAALTAMGGPSGLAELDIALPPGGPFVVNAMVEACDRSGVAPLFVRTGDGAGSIAATIRSLPEPQADRLVRRLLTALGATRVRYRALDGSAGVLAVAGPARRCVAAVEGPGKVAETPAGRSAA